MDEQSLLVSEGEQVSLWHTEAGRLILKGRWHLGGVTTRIFRADRTLILVGLKFGFVKARLLFESDGRSDTNQTRQ